MSEFSCFEDFQKALIVPEDTFYPDPGQDLAYFLQYLLKRHGGFVTLRECQRDWAKSIDVEAEVKRLGKERSKYLREDLKIPGKYYCLGIPVCREKQVHIQDTKWAQHWVRIYDVEPPHHAEYKKLSKK